jgi:glycine/D-amino acid oxidase-like deaminating enzyme
VLEPLVQHIGRRLTLKQAASGTFIIGGGWPSRAEQRPARYSTIWESAAGNAAVAVRVMPGLADVRVVRMWTGVWAGTSDLQPVLGQSAVLPGYFVCMAPTGFTLGPLVARQLAANIARNVPLPDEYAPDRKGVPWIETT